MESKLFKCDFCAETFRSSEQRKRHSKINHPEDFEGLTYLRRNHVCACCNEKHKSSLAKAKHEGNGNTRLG